MTAVDVCFRYDTPLGDREMRTLERLWEVYGIRRIQLNEQKQTIRVEYDATRLTADIVAALLRRAGIDARAEVALA